MLSIVPNQERSVPDPEQWVMELDGVTLTRGERTGELILRPGICDAQDCDVDHAHECAYKLALQLLPDDAEMIVQTYTKGGLEVQTWEW